jgi:two-component system, cell cycle sensor histidine kinase and response regulator CckA
MKISNRILITTGVIYLVASIIIVGLVNYSMRKQALIEAESKALMLLNHNLAVHQYLQELKPTLYSLSKSLHPADYFDPSWMSSTYAIRQINHYFRLLEKAKYYYKECAINARTPENEADPHEKVFLEQLARDPKLVERSEVLTLNGQPFLVIMRRGLEMKKSCLQCHSTPDRAPGDLVKIYPPTRSFGRLEGEVIHAIAIRIPLAEAYGQANRLSWHLSGILLTLLGCLFASQTWIGKHLLFDPMAALRQKVLEIAQSEARLGETIAVPPGPELRDLTTAFNAMSRNLRQSHDFLEERVRQRTADLNQLNERLEQDILQRKQAEEALRESEKTLRVLLDANPESLLLVDNELTVITANQTAAQRLGKRLDELIGVRLYDLFSKDLSKRRRSLIDEVIRTGQPVQFEDIREGINFYTYAHPVLDAAGKVSKVAILGLDITERKRVEKSIKENLRLRQQILDTIPSPIFYKGIDGRYQGINQAFLQFYGKTMEQVLGKTAHDVFPKEIAEKYLRMDQDLFQHPGIQVYEFHNYDAQGQRREMSLHKATFLDKDGSIAGLAGIMIDITEQKKAEEDRLRFSKLESLSTLAGGIAHDFNNILTAILGNIGLAMLDGKIKDRVQERLARAEQACLRAQSLAQQLLTFAKGGAPMLKSISIAKLLKESPILALSGSKSRHEVSIPDDLWSVEADEAQINQVISNLLINADQAMPRGGIIKIKAENCLVAAGSNLPISKGKYVKFAIADQGIGIPPKNLDQIFDPYFSTKQKGSGLGLATVYSIIKNHSGNIQVESQLGVGATFHIYLPATDKGVPAAEPERAKLTMGQGKVLVMDDEEMIREVLGGMLSRLGYDADFASDGSQAIEKFVQAQEANQAFDAVILDLTIPGGMGGKEAIQGLLKIDPQVKAIVSSGYSDDPIMADFRKYGVSEVIAKPYRVSELSKILRRVIPEQRAH